MPIVLTEELIQSAAQPEAGWSKLKLDEAKTVVKDGFETTILNWIITGGPGNSEENVNRRITTMLSGKLLSKPEASTFKTDLINTILNMLAAFLKKSKEEVKKAGEIDFKKFVGEELYGKIALVTDNGRTEPKVVEWAPNDVIPY